MSITDPEIESYLDRYGNALAAFDAKTSAQLWGLPGMLITDTFALALDSREVMAQGLRNSYPLYKALGLARVDHTLLERADLTDRIVRLRVRWHFYDADDVRMVDSDYEYLLRQDDGELLAYCSAGIDDAEKLGELAAKRGIDLAQFGATTAGADD